MPQKHRIRKPVPRQADKVRQFLKQLVAILNRSSPSSEQNTRIK